MINKSKERLIVEALEKIFGRTMKSIITDGKIIEWLEPGEVQPTNEQITQAVNEIIAEEPMRLLRIERDKKLSSTDWILAPDYTSPDQQDWVLYREKLRNLPQSVELGELPKPTLSEYGDLVFDQWPLEPN